MWTLECEGPLFHDKRLWLRPGTSHLFGRSKQARLRDTESYVLDAKSVSKKHLKISVSAVKPGYGSQLHSRTDIILEEFSKLGTTVDGERVSQTTKLLGGEQHVLKVARYEHALILRWQPVTFTIVGLTKFERQSEDPLSNYRAQLEKLDIKFSRDYVTGRTTHVVAQKRNLPPVLQGIIHGNYIVTKDYLDAVVRAATEQPSADGESEPKAPLEKDFNGSWPDPMKFVPPVASEPVKRDASYLAPKSERADIFYGYSFVFCMKPQYESLQAVINAGSGKAVLYEGFHEGRTDPKDFVAFVKNVAGEKGIGELGESDKGVVVVRITATNKDWDTKFVQESSRQLDLRFVEQNELLDAILTCDTSKLKQRLAEEIDLTSSRVHAPPVMSEPPAQETQPTLPSKREPPSQARSSAPRSTTVGKFKGFDAFDDSSDDEPAPKPAPPAATRSMPQMAKDVEMEDVSNLPASLPTHNTRRQVETNARKRPTPDPANDIDELLPGAARLKRRRLEEAANKAKAPTPEKKVVRQPKAEREVDVLAEAQKRLAKEEARAREDAQQLKEAMDEMDIVGPANLVQIEEMQLTRSVRSASVSRVSAASSDRWDPKWDGRPNFKRFKRRGDASTAGPGPGAVRSRQRNFVAVEETKRKDFGMGDEYWLESGGSRQIGRSQGDRQKHTQTQMREQSQTLREENQVKREMGVEEEEEVNEEDNTQFRRRRSWPEKAQGSKGVTAADNDEGGAANDDDDVELVEETLRTTGSVSQPPSTKKTTTKTAAATLSSKKRAAKDAPPPTVRAPPAKKKAWASRADSDGEGDEDEFAFPRARRSATAGRRG